MSSDIPPYPYDQPPPQPGGAQPPPPPSTPQPPPQPFGSQPPYPGAATPPPTNVMAIVSLICSLAGLIVGISAPVGAILGHIALKQIRERGEQGEGMAKAGIIVGWVLTGLFLLCCGVSGLGFLSTLGSNV